MRLESSTHVFSSSMLVLASLGVAGGCVKAPDIVLTDSRTAFEQQAAGEFRALENDLHQASIAPKGDDITREALEKENPNLGKSTLGEVAQLYSVVQNDAGWIDEMLVAGCIGEARDALLVRTPDTCDEDLDTGQVTRVLERVNLHRRQLWQVMQKRDPKATDEQIRQSWRQQHLKRVVCGGLVQQSDDDWEKKSC